jgi:uncharacterized protein YjbI with pentapeptide repeats
MFNKQLVLQQKTQFSSPLVLQLEEERKQTKCFIESWEMKTENREVLNTEKDGSNEVDQFEPLPEKKLIYFPIKNVLLNTDKLTSGSGNSVPCNGNRQGKDTIKILIDSDLVLELFLGRQQWSESVARALKYLQSDNVRVYVTSLSIAKLHFYLGIEDPNLAEEAIIWLSENLKAQIIDIQGVDISQCDRANAEGVNIDREIEILAATDNELDRIMTLLHETDEFSATNIVLLDKTELKSSRDFDPNSASSGESLAQKEPGSLRKLLLDADLVLEFFLDRQQWVDLRDRTLKYLQSDNVRVYVTSSSIAKLHFYLGIEDPHIAEKATIWLERELKAQIVDLEGADISTLVQLPFDNFDRVQNFDRDIEILATQNKKLDGIITLFPELYDSSFANIVLPVWVLPNLTDENFAERKSLELHPDAKNSRQVEENEWIKRKFPNKDFQGVDLTGRDLSRQDLRDANFKEAILRGVDLSGANLQNANFYRADLQKANLRRADLENANLSESNLERADLGGASLLGACLDRANLKGAALKGVNLMNASLIEATLIEAKFRGAKLQNAQLTRADLRKADIIRANLIGAVLEGANLRGALLNNAVMKRANLDRADLRGDSKNPNILTQMICVKLSGAKLRQANLSGIHARRTNFTEADLSEVNLEGAKLQNTNFEDAKLYKAMLKDADLGGAILTKANLKNANLTNVFLRGASLQKANLEGVNLEKAQLQGAYLREVNLEKANLSHSKAFRANFNLAILRSANLEHSELLNASFIRAELSDANLKESKLEGAILTEAKLINVDLSLSLLQGASLKKADLTGANLEGAKMQGSYLKDAKLTNAILKDADLSRCRLKRANLQGARLDRAILRGTDFRYAILRQSCLNKTQLEWSNLTGADLSESDLQSVNLSWSNLSFTILEKANLSHADLSGSDLSGTNLRHSKLCGANLFRARLLASDLEGADLTESNCRYSYFTDANLTHVNLTDADLRSAHLCGANLENASLIASKLEGANLLSACFRGATLEPTHLLDADLQYVDLDRADANSADSELVNAVVKTDLRQHITDRLLDARDMLERLQKGIDELKHIQEGFNEKPIEDERLKVIQGLAEKIELAKQDYQEAESFLDSLQQNIQSSDLSVGVFQKFLSDLHTYIYGISQYRRILGKICLEPRNMTNIYKTEGLCDKYKQVLSSLDLKTTSYQTPFMLNLCLSSQSNSSSASRRSEELYTQTEPSNETDLPLEPSPR